MVGPNDEELPFKIFESVINGIPVTEELSGDVLVLLEYEYEGIRGSSALSHIF
jgi:hypothetical protein